MALVITRSPDEPGVVTVPRLTTGPVQLMSKLAIAPTETGTSNLNSALGMSK